MKYPTNTLNISPHLLVHGFALTHLIVVLLFSFLGWNDVFLLSLLSATMVVLLMNLHRFSHNSTLAYGVAASLAGYYLGTNGVEWIGSWLLSDVGRTINALSSFLITEIIGLSILLIAHPKQPQPLQSLRATEIGILVGAITLFRLLYIDLVVYIGQMLKLPMETLVFQLTAQSPFIVLSFFADYYIVRHSFIKTPNARTLIRLFTIQPLYLLVVSLGSSYYVVKISNIGENLYHSNPQVLLAFLVLLLIHLLVIVFFNLQCRTQYLQRQALQEQERKTLRILYDYNRLRRQINPHFLFNSLNVLNSLLSINPTRAASFIQKMAKVYRYLLSQEEATTVPLSEEIAFSKAFFEMLSERFQGALSLRLELKESTLTQPVIPCSIQIQIENAVKHNIVDEERPLLIEIFEQNNQLIVRNNLQPRLHVSESTGIGLAGIRTQYQKIFDQDIEVEMTEEYFIVRLPLIGSQTPLSLNNT